MANILTAYFSRKGENYFDGSIRFLKKGNTEIIAEAISEATGSDLFEIDTARPYADDYHSCTLEAKEEFSQNARPALAHDLSDLSSYDTIFLGFPNWWSTCPMAVLTFLESHDFSGKRIIPFCTNEGSGMGRSEKDIARSAPKAIVEKGLSILGSQAPMYKEKAAQWAKEHMEG